MATSHHQHSLMVHFMNMFKQKGIKMANESIRDRIKKIAVEVSGQSELCIGRNKIDTKTICSFDSLTLREFDFINYDDKSTGEHVSYPVLIFDEIPDGFYCGGMALSDLCNALKDEPEFMAELKESGLKMSFEATRTKTGNTYVNFTVL